MRRITFKAFRVGLTCVAIETCSLPTRFKFSDKNINEAQLSILKISKNFKLINK